MSNWIYWRSEPGIWTVGVRNNNYCTTDSDHDNRDAAAKRVHFLNGGCDASCKHKSPQDVNAELLAALKYVREWINNSSGDAKYLDRVIAKAEAGQPFLTIDQLFNGVKANAEATQKPQQTAGHNERLSTWEAGE